METLGDQEIEIDVHKLPKDPFLIKVTGTDITGSPFTRLSYFDDFNLNKNLPSLTVDVGEGSELLLTPNRRANIYFEVTNNRDQALYVTYNARDEKSLLAALSPRR